MATAKAKEIEYPEIRIHNLETGEIIDRPMTAEEYAEWQAQEAEWIASRPTPETNSEELAAYEEAIANAPELPGDPA
jgi:hypothetical protein